MVHNGKVYCGGIPYGVVYDSFDRNFKSAEMLSDTEMVAHTIRENDSGYEDFDVFFKLEDGVWKIDRLMEYYHDEDIKALYPDGREQRW